MVFFLMYASFNEAHWILVNCYRKAYTGSRHNIEGTKESNQEADREDKFYKLGLAANCLFPCLQSVFIVFYYVRSYDDQTVLWLKSVASAMLICMNLTLIVSGVLLLRVTGQIK